MTYATPTDFIAAFPDDESVELTNLDDPKAVAPVLSRIETALSEAESEINCYVGMVASLPLPSVPVVLKNAAIRIARYRLDSYNPREFVRNDYEDQVKFLKLVSEGKVNLGLNAQNEPLPSTDNKSGIGYRTAPRVFTRQSMRGYGGWW